MGAMVLVICLRMISSSTNFKGLITYKVILIVSFGAALIMKTPLSADNEPIRCERLTIIKGIGD